MYDDALELGLTRLLKILLEKICMPTVGFTIAQIDDVGTMHLDLERVLVNKTRCREEISLLHLDPRVRRRTQKDLLGTTLVGNIFQCCRERLELTDVAADAPFANKIGSRRKIHGRRRSRQRTQKQGPNIHDLPRSLSRTFKDLLGHCDFVLAIHPAVTAINFFNPIRPPPISKLSRHLRIHHLILCAQMLLQVHLSLLLGRQQGRLVAR